MTRDQIGHIFAQFADLAAGKPFEVAARVNDRSYIGPCRPDFAHELLCFYENGLAYVPFAAVLSLFCKGPLP